jgi:4a-hydroxytetrahydrobiopterin dehydratase
MSNPARKPLTKSEIRTALAELPGWSFKADKLTKQFELPKFPDAVAFIVRLGFEAEKMDHHPELANVYNRVVISLNSHDAGNKVTGMDVELARKIEKVRAAMS